MLIAGGYFSSFQGYIDGNVTIMNKATGENQTFIIYVDATTYYASWDSDHHVVILPPGEYTLFWQFIPGALNIYIYSHGWFMTDHDDPKEVNGLQNLIIMVSGFAGAFIVLFGICLVSGKKKYYIH